MKNWIRNRLMKLGEKDLATQLVGKTAATSAEAPKQHKKYKGKR